jgi:hypothetical protein
MTEAGKGGPKSAAAAGAAKSDPFAKEEALAKSEAVEKLERSRQAILAHIARRERRHDPHEETAQGIATGDEEAYDDPGAPGEGWVAHMGRAVRTWWRYHPAHMAVELVDPLLRGYARRKPVQLLAISAAAGAVLVLARPWKIISVGTLAIALLKSSQISSLLIAAVSAADYQKDNDRPG